MQSFDSTSLSRTSISFLKHSPAGFTPQVMMTQFHFNPSIILFSTSASSPARRMLAPIPGEVGGDTSDKLAVYRRATRERQTTICTCTHTDHKFGLLCIFWTVRVSRVRGENPYREQLHQGGPSFSFLRSDLFLLLLVYMLKLCFPLKLHMGTMEVRDIQRGGDKCSWIVLIERRKSKFK